MKILSQKGGMMPCRVSSDKLRDISYEAINDETANYENTFIADLCFDLLDAREQLEAMQDGASKLDDYDSGYMNDYGGGNIGWWQDYIRAEVNRCNDFWRSQIENILPE